MNSRAAMRRANKCRWFQFRLRTLLLFTGLIAVLLSVATTVQKSTARQRAAIAKIEAVRGGGFLYDYEYDFSPEGGRPPGWVRPQTPHSLLLYIFGRDIFADVMYVQLADPCVTDDTLNDLLNALQSLPEMQHLCLRGARITDRSVPVLSQLGQLGSLDVMDTDISEDGARALCFALPKCIVRSGVSGQLLILEEPLAHSP